MTGICGIKTKNSNYGKKDLNKMLKCLSHRGNKFKDLYQDKSIIIGIQSDRKDIVKNNSDPIKTFVDGLIYNKNELISNLGLEISDEVGNEEFLSHIYKRGGFRKINGDFISVIWDEVKKQLNFTKYLTNDKNIFYRKKGDTLFFSSEMKSILNLSQFKNEIDYDSVSDFITFGHIPYPNTLFKNIKRVPPLTSLIYTQNGKIQKKKLNFFQVKSKKKFKNIKKIVNKMEVKFNESIKQRLKVSDDFGLYLSGGIDSSTILYFLDKHTEEPVDTYTVALSHDGPYAKKMSQYFDTNHTEKKLDGETLINAVPKSLWHLEYPQDHAGVFQYFLPKISEDKKYTFWGQGGEEAVFGRRDYVALNLIKNIKKIFPDKLKEIISNRMPQLPNKNQYFFLYNVFTSESHENIYVSLREIMPEMERKELFYPRVAENNLERIKGKNKTDEILHSYSYITMLSGFLSDSFPSMHQEILNPFMDKDFLNYCYSIPPHIKIKNFKSRFLLKRMMRDKLPNYVINRGRDSWSDQTKSMVENNKKIFYTFANKLKNRNILRNNINNFSKKYKFKLDEKLWSLVTLEVLFEIFIDRNYSKEPPKLENLI